MVRITQRWTKLRTHRPPKAGGTQGESGVIRAWKMEPSQRSQKRREDFLADDETMKGGAIWQQESWRSNHPRRNHSEHKERRRNPQLSLPCTPQPSTHSSHWLTYVEARKQAIWKRQSPMLEDRTKEMPENQANDQHILFLWRWCWVWREKPCAYGVLCWRTERKQERQERKEVAKIASQEETEGRRASLSKSARATAQMRVSICNLSTVVSRTGQPENYRAHKNL